jgi:LemA protein
MKAKWLSPLVVLLFTACGYNTIQSMDESAAASQQQIEVQLQRRADLVPNLVQTVKGFAAQEERIFTEVAHVGEMANANQNLTGALGRLLAISENYPQLKSDQNFLRLQDELTGTENRIAVSRTDYNNAVRDYNAYIRRFPAVLTAKVTGAKSREYFEVTNAENREAPTVTF